MLKLATWNFCLGLKNKKDYVSSVINEKQIDVNNPLLLTVVFTLGTPVLPTCTSTRRRYQPL